MNDLAREAIDILVDNGIVSQTVADHMSEQSFNKYTKKYFLMNMKVLSAMQDVPESSWKIVEASFEDPRYDALFKEVSNESDMEAEGDAGEC